MTLGLVVNNDDTPLATEMTGGKRILWHLRWRIVEPILRSMPRLVWVGQELDVKVTFDQPVASSAELATVERHLQEMGITCDTGFWIGGGRDWEWDSSLSGPVHVTFRGRAKRPDKRRPAQPHPKPHLVA